MHFEDAKRNILRRFPLGTDPVSIYQHISDEDYVALLAAVKKSIPFSKPNQNQSLTLFLYSGCLKFDRWLAPTPTVLNEKHTNRYKEFVNALIQAERGVSDNTGVFILRILKNDLFSELDSIPVELITSDALDSFSKKISDVPSPSHMEKHREFIEEKQKIEAIIDGIRDGTLKTTIRTKIPYIVHLKPLELSLQWSGLTTVIKLAPAFADIPSFVSIRSQGMIFLLAS